jgi:hypothetical protein
LDFGLLLLILFILAPLLERLLGMGRGQQPPQGPGGPQGPRPGQRTPGEPMPGQGQRRMPQPRDAEEEELPFRSVPAGHRNEEDPAAGMLPDDLWEILTGEKRPPRQAPPQQGQEAAPQPVLQRQERPDPVRPVPPPVDRRPDLAQRNEARRAEEQRRRDQRDREGTRGRPAAPPRERSLPPVEVRDRSPRERERLRPAGPPPGPADRHVRPMPVRAQPVLVSYDADLTGDEVRPLRSPARDDAATVAPSPRVQLFGNVADLRKAIIAAEVLGRPRGLD